MRHKKAHFLLYADLTVEATKLTARLIYLNDLSLFPRKTAS
jgi:hypothetical protein